MKPEQRKILVAHLVQGWVLALLALGFVNFFPQVELATYDSQIVSYRYLPKLFYWWREYWHRYDSNGYTGLHRSITLVGGQGVSASNEEEATLEALRHYRKDKAAAATWITDGVAPAAAEMLNKSQQSTLVFALAVQPYYKVKAGDQPPFLLKTSETDGVVRELYLAVKDGPGNLTPCLPLVLFSRFLGQEVCTPRVSASVLELGDRRIPVNEDDTGYSLPLVPYFSSLRAREKLSGGLQTAISDPMEPLRLADVLKWPNLYFGEGRVRGRFFFLGNDDMVGTSQRKTSTGEFRDFQLAAMGLDTLIQGPHLRWVSGWPRWLYYFLTSSLLALWLLSPASPGGRLFRVLGLLVAWTVLGLALVWYGYYLPMAWVVVQATFLTAWTVARIWLTSLGYLRRYGGSAAAQLLESGQSNLDHSVAEERLATIVFVGLPSHLRQQELEDDPKILEHRQIFSEQIATITHRFAGIVHDFQADYLMLGFGTHPGRRDADHAHKAFMAAQQLVALRTMLNNVWLPKVDQGARVQVSVNCGLVAVGWVGTSKFKRASAAIGDTTNVAARLLGTAKKLNLDMVVAQSAYELLKEEARFEPLPPVMLKGKSEAVAIFKLADPA